MPHVQSSGCAINPHLAPLCKLPCHNPVQDVLPDWHVEDAAREYDVANSVVLPVKEGKGEIRTLGLRRSPALGCKAA